MLSSIAILFIGLASQAAIAQDIEILYEQRLLDNSIQLERLKPLHEAQKYAYEQQGKELKAVRDELQFEKLQSRLQESKHEGEIDKLNRQGKKRFWSGVKLGSIATATLISVLLLAPL